MGSRGIGGEAGESAPEMACGGWGRWLTLAAVPNREEAGGAQGAGGVMRAGGAGRGLTGQILASVRPEVTCSLPITRSDSQLIALTADYLPINRLGQLMQRICAIRVGHATSSDYQADYLIIRPNSRTMKNIHNNHKVLSGLALCLLLADASLASLATAFIYLLLPPIGNKCR
jgi:hypothetical protein